MGNCIKYALERMNTRVTCKRMKLSRGEMMKDGEIM